MQISVSYAIMCPITISLCIMLCQGITITTPEQSTVCPSSRGQGMTRNDYVEIRNKQLLIKVILVKKVPKIVL